MSQNLFVDFKGAALIRLMGTIVLMVLLLPSLSFAKNAFSDKDISDVTAQKGVTITKIAISQKDLDEVTAQEGVTINFGCFTLGAITVAVSSWGDSDGCSTCCGYTSAGWIGASVTMSSNFVGISGNMTIDVGTSGSRTALIIGLPSLSLAGSMTEVVKLASANNLTGGALGTLGTSYMSGVQLSPSGYLTIFAH